MTIIYLGSHLFASHPAPPSNIWTHCGPQVNSLSTPDIDSESNLLFNLKVHKFWMPYFWQIAFTIFWEDPITKPKCSTYLCAIGLISALADAPRCTIGIERSCIKPSLLPTKDVTAVNLCNCSSLDRLPERVVQQPLAGALVPSQGQPAAATQRPGWPEVPHRLSATARLRGQPWAGPQTPLRIPPAS